MNASPRRKTYDEHVAYLHEIVRLKLFFLWTWLRRHPEESFSQALRTRVDIYRKTDINEGFANHKARRFDDLRWLELEGALEEWHRRCCDEADASRFEEEGFRRVRPLVDARSRRDFEEPPEAIAFNYCCGSLDYDPPTPANPRRVFLHIANALQPRSIFDELGYLADCFTALMCRCRREFDADSLETVTWLNSYPRWLKYFPDEWRANLGPELGDVDCGFHFWGQFLTARGTFNDRHGRHLRTTGSFPFWPRHSWCRFEPLAGKLKALKE